MNEMYVFVYGTLMRGHPNFRVMQRARGNYVSKAKIYNKDLYYAYSEGSFPAMVDGKGVVYGEVFRIPDYKLRLGTYTVGRPVRVLDGLEGYRKGDRNSMYIRKRGIVHLIPSGKKIWASYYHWNSVVDDRLKIVTGDYNE